MGQEPSELKKSIERTIREGVDKEYLGIVKDLKDTYYLEDIAAAAIAICAKQGGPQGVRRRTLHDVSFVPLKTGEAKGTDEKKKPAQHPSKPGAVRKNPQEGRGGPAGSRGSAGPRAPGGSSGSGAHERGRPGRRR